MLMEYLEEFFDVLWSKIEFQEIATPEFFGLLGVAVGSAAFFLYLKVELLNEMKVFWEALGNENNKSTEEGHAQDMQTCSSAPTTDTKTKKTVSSEDDEESDEQREKELIIKVQDEICKEEQTTQKLLHKIVAVPRKSFARNPTKPLLKMPNNVYNEDDERKIIFEIHQTAMMSYDVAQAQRCIALLMACPAAVNAPRYPYGFTPFLSACWAGSLPLVRYMLQNGADLNRLTDDADTPMYLAVRALLDTQQERPPLDLLNILYNAGASVNCANRAGFTPLHLATSCNNKHVITWLLERGASLTARTFHGHRAIDIARQKEFHDLVLTFSVLSDEAEEISRHQSKRKCADHPEALFKRKLAVNNGEHMTRSSGSFHSKPHHKQIHEENKVFDADLTRES